MVNLYGTTAFAGIVITLPGGSLAIISHLLPAFGESPYTVYQPLKSLSTRLTNLPDTDRVSPVWTDCFDQVSSSILTKRLCSCACTPCASACWNICAIDGPTAPSATITPIAATINFLSTISLN